MLCIEFYIWWMSYCSTISLHVIYGAPITQSKVKLCDSGGIERANLDVTLGPY